ncbi:MAG: glutathione S-transferase family protein [Geminicoccaceae bacterium]
MSHDETVIFYHAVPSRSMVVHWLLEELGAPYRIERMRLDQGDQRKPEFLALNPMGKVPVIVHHGVVITEVAAICAYLADAFPDAGLAPPIGDPQRGTYLRWLVFGPASLEPAVTDRMFNRPPAEPRALGYGDFDRTMDTLAGALTPGPYLLGERFSAADIVVGANLMWASMMGAIPERPAFEAYASRLIARPARQRADAEEQEIAGVAG